MKKILLFLFIPLLFAACHKEDDDIRKFDSENDYEILSYSEGSSLFLTFSYPSVDENGKLIRLSSALMAYNPAQRDSSSFIRSVIISCHITNASEVDCPSRIKSSLRINDATIMNSIPVNAKIPELKQSVIIMPDYQGFGISEQYNHPYMSQELTARQVADAVRYGLLIYKELSNPLPFADDWKSFCIGFSQGGAVALATQRYIEQHALDKELHFVGSFCGEGPYDLLETVKYHMLDDGNTTGIETGHTKGTIDIPVVLPLIIKGMIDSNSHMKKHSITDYLSKQFIDTGIIDWIASKQKSTNDIAKDWYEMCEKGLTAKDGTHYSPEQMQELFPDHGKKRILFQDFYSVKADLFKLYTPELAEYLSNPSTYNSEHHFTGDKKDDMLATLELNSTVTGWQPVHKIILLHSQYDTVIPATNLIAFTSSHPDADIKTVYFGKENHLETGIYFFLALLDTTFSEEFTWLFAEK